MTFEDTISVLNKNSNYRSFKSLNYCKDSLGKLDLSSNDYLGLSQNKSYVEEFFEQINYKNIEMSSVASRLLSLKQKEFYELEDLLSSLYGKSALIFNSGYHANTGVISAIADKDTLIVADKLVHASIIDGIILSRAQFIRFRHNDYEHLQSIIEKEHSKYERILVVTESIFSMDGDRCDLHRFIDLKNEFRNILLYVDEAHAFGVVGERGLGCCEQENVINDIDIIIGTLGKAAASTGAFVITNSIIKQYLINKSRSLIFSTAIPPINCMWSTFIIKKLLSMSSERENLSALSTYLQNYVNPLNNGIKSDSQIIPLVLGDNELVVRQSEYLYTKGYIALPIRIPTVPKGTERIRFSLNATLKKEDIMGLISTLKNLK